MQSLLDTVRATGATNVVMAGGLNWADDMSGWLAHKPKDPQGQLAASWHAYAGSNHCETVTCWERIIRPLAAAVPVIVGETGEDKEPLKFVNTFLPWADAAGLSYFGWSWLEGGTPQLINSYNGTPKPGWGAYFKEHLATLPQ
jgi:hypothetical protein